MSSLRDIVTTRIGRRVRQFPDLDVTALDTGALDLRDAALASAIDTLVARHWMTLQALIDARLSRAWDRVEPDLRAALLVGAAQMVYLDRVPVHAAISEAVYTAKRLVRPGAGGLVNAVLRALTTLRGERQPTFSPDRCDELPLGDGGAWHLAADLFPADPLSRLALQTSHPLPVLERWVARTDVATAARRALHGLATPPIILAGIPADTSASLSPHALEGHLLYDGSRQDLHALLDSHPEARVQDPGSALPVQATVDLQPECIIDACAGMGTKTHQLAAVHPGARIIAMDRHPQKHEALTRRFCGHDQVTIVPWSDRDQYYDRADLLVLDVPCSNSGVFSRRVEAKYRCREEKLASLSQLQKQVVADTMLLRNETGAVLYATCSIEPLENEDQARWICSMHDMEIAREHMNEPAGLPGESPTGWMDGGYHAVLLPKAG